MTMTPCPVDDGVLERVRSLMDEHDDLADGTFPYPAWDELVVSGIPATGADGAADVADELALVREVSRADVSLGRILDGHLNAVQRLVEQLPRDVAEPELAAVRDGRLALGVWGADPGPQEGEPAHLEGSDDGTLRVTGVKTFCSGAGGLHRAFVLVRDRAGGRPGTLAYVDLTDRVVVDRTWFRGAGMRGSASHRVVFSGARVLWAADRPGTLLQQPWFAQDGLRTAAGWAGGADRVLAETLARLRGRGRDDDLDGLAVARMLQARRSLDLWLRHGAEAVTDAGPTLADEVTLARSAIASAVRTTLDTAAEVLGSRPYAAGGAVERTTRDLRTYLLQHRLEPLLVRVGRSTLVEGDRGERDPS